MPIICQIDKEKNLIIAEFIGKVTDKEMLDAYRALFQDKDWSVSLNELTDLSRMDGVDMTFEGLKSLSEFIGATLQERGARPKVAIYAPTDLAYGLARVYAARSVSFEDNNVFRNIEDAKRWLVEGQINNTTGEGLRKTAAPYLERRS